MSSSNEDGTTLSLVRIEDPSNACSRLALRFVLPVVAVGETGVGKESAARAVHFLGGRSGPFHAVNCAALPTLLTQSMLPPGLGRSAGAAPDAATPMSNVSNSPIAPAVDDAEGSGGPHP